MFKRTTVILMCIACAAPSVQAAPALGPALSSDVNPTVRRPIQPQVQNDPRLDRKPLWTAPRNLKQLGTAGGIDSDMPVYRHRGSAGSMNLTHDIQLRPAF
ncbi:MAG: hypothetical protein AAGG11_23900 [Pseudomonadota bacterium]